MRAEVLRGLVVTLGAGLALAGCGQGGSARAAGAAEAATPAAATAEGPSFDCKAAKTALEHAVCGDPKLAAADREMSAAYKRLAAALPAEARKPLARAQASFLAYAPIQCATAAGVDTSCLRGAYELQAVELDGALRADAQGRRFLSLVTYQAWPSPAGADPDDRRPERISRSIQALAAGDPGLSAWNAMITAKLAAWEQAHGGDPRKDGGYDAAATVFGTTADLIETQVEVTYTPQMGLTQRSHWSLKLGRELTAADLFKDTKTGVEALARLAASEMGGVDPAEIADPAGWAFAPDGLQLLPQEPQAPGATVSWAALKPWLRADLPFDPAKLTEPESAASRAAATRKR